MAHGRRLWVRVNGQRVECGTIGEFAKAFGSGRSSHSIREYERRGLIPCAPLILPSDDYRGRRRLYPVQLISAIAELTARDGIGRWLSSKYFSQNQQQLGDVWHSSTSFLRPANQGITRTGRL